jgi:DNA-binding transcriptional ArsR family regulator
MKQLINFKKEVFFMEKKITKVQMFGMIREAVADNADMVAFIDHEIELLQKKSNKPKKVKEEDIALRNEVLATLSSFEEVTVSQLQKKSDALSELSNQKVSSILKKLTDEGLVDKTVKKKISYFSLVTAE